MKAIDMIKKRRSIRKYKPEIVDENVMNEIVDAARYAPSWANSQTARYTFITNEKIIAKIASEGVKNFAYNKKTLEKTKNVAVLSYVKGKSGKLKDVKEDTFNEKWEIFDAGIACQNFCLAAYTKNVGTCIFGVIDENVIAKLINLPEEESIAAIITYGYFEDDVIAPSRLEVSQISRYIK